MHVLVIGVNHQIQPAEIKSMRIDGTVEAFEREQKEAFGRMLREQIRDRGIQFVAEEARHGKETIAQNACGGITEYANVDMSAQERGQRNIPPGYRDDPMLSDSEKSRCDGERETYMCDKTIEGSAGVENILIICGRHHAEAIATEMRRRGHMVDVSDLQEQAWYIEDWAEHCMRNL